MGVGMRIKEVLRKNGMTIKQLAEKTGISVNTLYSITKRDSKKIDKVLLNQIAKALNCDPEWLQTGMTDEEFSIGMRKLSETAEQALKDRTSVLTEAIESGTKVPLLDIIQELSEENMDALLKYAIFLKIQEKISKEKEGEPDAVDPQENDKDGA